MEFTQLNLSKPLLKAVAAAGYESPSPIQEKAIPPVLSGRDLLGCAQTGTGKTAAFALPILQLLAGRPAAHKGAIRALVLTPTRELALQIYENFAAYGKGLPLRSAVIFGGVGQAPQVAALRRGVDILVATPGRLNDLIGQGFIKLGDLEIFVLDEADRMLDMGFVNDVKKVVAQIPKKRQTLLFSATMPDEIVALADSLLYKPAKVFVTPPSTTVEMIDQSLYKIDKANKRRLLAEILRRPDVSSALVFTRTKHGADRVARDLGRAGISAAAIHGNKSQGARQSALDRFKKGEVRALVATDIAARGIDIHELSHVVNFDLPNIPETYVHRIGRTGRAGHGGTAISFCCADELPYLADIERLIGFTVPEVEGHSWPMLDGPAVPAKKAQNGVKKGGKNTPENTQKNQNKMPKQNAHGKGQPTASPQKQGAAKGGAGKASPNAGRNAAGNKGGKGRRAPMKPFDPYENLTGGKAIVTRTPVWGSAGTDAPQAPAAQPKQEASSASAPLANKGDDQMSRNNRRRGGRNRNKKPGENTTAKPAVPAIPKNEKGVFDFSEAELAEDDALKVVSRRTGETKYANFEDFLKDQ